MVAFIAQATAVIDHDDFAIGHTGTSNAEIVATAANLTGNVGYVIPPTRRAPTFRQMVHVAPITPKSLI